MAGDILICITGEDIEKAGQIERVTILWGRVFLGKQIRAIEGAPAWMTGESVETTG